MEFGMLRSRVLRHFGLLLAGSAMLAQASVIGTYEVNYRDNAAGCIDGFPDNPSGGNPYSCNYIGSGPIFLNEAPGIYTLRILSYGSAGPSWMYIWIGDQSAGEHIRVPQMEVGSVFSFANTANKIAFYYWDWYPFDNTPTLSVRFELSDASSPTPEPATLFLLGPGLLWVVALNRRGRRPWDRITVQER